MEIREGFNGERKKSKNIWNFQLGSLVYAVARNGESQNSKKKIKIQAEHAMRRSGEHRNHNDIIEDLKLMLDSNNVVVSSYRMVRDTFKKYPQVDMKLKIIGRRDRDGRTYNLPIASEVAALIIGDISDLVENRDIVVELSRDFYNVSVNCILLTFLSNIRYYFHMEMMVTTLIFFIEGSSIKYLFKYINKRRDRATVGIVQSNNECDTHDAVDEINEYYDCRYLSACESSWRIFKYDVHYRYPSVVRLSFHLPGWMECNAVNADARKLTYVEFPTKFVWQRGDRIWKPQKVGKCVGRIHSVSPNLGEAYIF
ncbi:unnamed protein product [Lactuca virosa]|uniref:Uncharacterized protein n=1 Tax=Lactuca virosa TaxID=75947 RepID=A0AAU9MMF9_9ASTR|nr:unnamed protein product [Lactuca virosa]